MVKRIGLLGLVVMGCSSSGGTGDASDMRARSSSVQQALQMLDGESRAAWEWSSDAHVRTPEGFGLAVNRVEGRSARLLVNGLGARDATVAFLTKFRDEYKMRDPANEFVVTREQHDELGMTHVRLQQVERGVIVRGAETLAHYDDSGALRVIDSSYVPGLDALDLAPALSADQVLARARAELAAADARVERAPELVIHAREGQPAVLAYHLILRTDAPQRVDYTVDARTGAILSSFDDIETVDGSGTGVAGDTKTLHLSSSGNGFSLVDTTRTPGGIRTYTTSNKSSGLPGTLVTSNSATSWDTAAPGPGAAVDAHFFAGIVYDYYKTAHNRLGLDGQNGAITSSVHYSTNLVNAFWDGQQMAYGDGNGTTYRALSVSLDVVGHELTHGVTQFTSALTYQGQTGALNEAMSDIMGSIIEHSFNPDPVNNWLLGEAVSTTGTPFRDLIHPAAHQQPANLSKYVNTQQDNGGVHTNSGIPNNAFFLMTMGGTNDVSNVKVPAGIGWDKAAQLWYRTETTYLTSSANFSTVANGNISAANDLKFTEDEKSIVQCAWIAVGVIANPSTCAPLVGSGTGAGNGDGGGAGNGTGGGDGGGAGNGTGGGSGQGQGVGDPGGSGNGSGSGGGDGTDESSLGGKGASCSVSPGDVGGTARASYDAVMLGAAGVGVLFARRRRRGKSQNR